jgi:hypothetical protein
MEKNKHHTKPGKRIEKAANVPVPAQATVMNIVKHCQAHFRIESLT